MDNQSRINYYLGDLANHKKIKQKITAKDQIQERNKVFIMNTINNLKEGLKISNSVIKLKYINALRSYLINNFPKHRNKKIALQGGDVYFNIDKYCFTKARNVNDKKPVILKLMNHDRHWQHFYERPSDIPFEKKKNVIFWRGISSGSQKDNMPRLNLLKKHFRKHSFINVGFSVISVSFRKNVINNPGRNKEKEKFTKYVLGKASMSTFLQHKYIISVEGVDKDSGLNWKLNSNSLVIMPKPTKISWLMEDQLKDKIHYVEVKDDFSDLVEKYKWCEENQDEVKKIIGNANKFMSQFSNKKREKIIENKVIQAYLDKVEIIN